ncbi:hypothetical protein [Streptomyces lonarensis]|uniref:Uncharacterized protein n=1 Tax=Streptomyces lonarensis TaxID=700599 RepID=A0A7X6D0A6_9ACTN|nr:hypothetical protein [Streptomyces lonarensis]NJQ05795.1 hypothetical protein [Streptomyces lonarensis]
MIRDGNSTAPETETGHESGEIDAQARITCTVTRGSGGTGALKSATPWEPPACYCAPTYTPEEMARHWQDFYANTNRDIWADDMRESFDANHKEQYGEVGKSPDYRRRSTSPPGSGWTTPNRYRSAPNSTATASGPKQPPRRPDSPSTPAPQTHHPPTDGICEASDGSIGTAWASGASSAPPCGITYTRATTDRSAYPLSAALTWEVTWSDSFGDSGTLPDGEFSTTLDIPVEEVQTIVR